MKKRQAKKYAKYSKVKETAKAMYLALQLVDSYNRYQVVLNYIDKAMVNKKRVGFNKWVRVNLTVSKVTISSLKNQIKMLNFINI